MGKENKIHHYHLLLLLLLLFSPSHSAASGDDAVMSALAKTLSGVPSSWNSSPDPCKWAGVKCTSGRVTSIDLNSKSITGTLPDSLGQLSSLQNLDLGENLISGPIPSLSDLSSLQTLDLGKNGFTSIPDSFFSGLTGLQTIVLDDNPLAPWPIPLDLAQCAALQSFSAANASVSGEIPDAFGKLPTITELKLSYNHLTGGLPSSFAGSSIQNLYLNNQNGTRLSGRIDVVGAMAQLKLVWIQSNGFTGPIPDLSNLTSLTSFNARDNQLTGLVPPSLISCPTLKDATLSNNNLLGPFPNFAGNVVADVSKGNLFCRLDPVPCDPRVMVLLSVAGGFGYPSELINSQNPWKGNDPCGGGWAGVGCDTQGNDIVAINLANKHYGGIISPDFANLTSLKKIILSNNNLTGPIPDSLTKLPRLQVLDVTNNSLTGKIPAFPPSVSLVASGNPMLGSDSSPVPSDGGGGGGGGGGGSGSPSGGGILGSPSTGNSSAGSSSSHASVIAGILAAVFVLIGCSVGLVYYQRRKKQTQDFRRVPMTSPSNKPEMVKIGVDMNLHNGATSELYSQSSAGSGNAHMIEAQSMLMSIQTLRKATNNFSEDNILGRGGFGVVYKGEQNGTLIAVKRNESDMMGKKGMEEFQAEIAVLRKVRHRHLVALLGYCVDGYERLLVYEYMPEGTLGQHLFDRHESRYSPLNWKQRLTIALDVARGIEYLHSLAQESFIHRDIKPSNILLDKDMRAKVSDFGLVKLADNEKSMMTRLAGTFGYLAPEYAITGKVSTKVDVYAFGVILMEIITGRKALDDSLPDEETHLVSSFRRNILNKDKFVKHVDPTLDLDEEAWGSMFEVSELAHHCTAREPNQRPDMGHAVNVLSPLVEKWKPNNCDNEDNYEDSSVSLSQRLEKWQFDDGTSTMDMFSSYKGSASTNRD